MEEEEEEDEEEEPIVVPKKKAAESAAKVRKDHINVVFIGHVGEFVELGKGGGGGTCI